MIRNAFDISVFNVHLSAGGTSASGFNISWPSIVNGRSLLIGVNIQLVTSAVVAERTLRIKLVSPGADIVICSSHVSQPASKTYQYYFGIGFDHTLDSNNLLVTAPLIPDAMALEPWTFDTDLLNLSAGDITTLKGNMYKFWNFEQ